MQSMKKSGSSAGLLGICLGLALLIAPPAFAQVAAGVSIYTGTLMIGFGDPNNLPPLGNDFANNGVPACAQDNPFLPATIATVDVFGFAVQGTGSPASIMFAGYQPIDFNNQTGGGQPPIVSSTCIVQFPPWLANNALRSRVQFGSQVWPGNKVASVTPSGMAVLTTGPGGGTVSAGGGNTATVTFSPLAFYASGAGQQQIVPGPDNFGGGVPVNGNGNVQLGVNFAQTNGTGQPLSTFGIVPYATGFLPTGPAVYGTDATGTDVPIGVRGGNPYTWVARTAGPMGSPFTIPLTTNLGWSQGVTQTVGGGVPFTTPGDFDGIFQKWTTGMVQHTDTDGDYTTVRAATGHDWTTAEFTANGTSAPQGTTRKLQLVTPWSASIAKRGDRPWAGLLADLPDFGFGGLAILTLDITPVPEPGTASLLGFGALGLVGLGAIRRRSR